MVGFFVVSENVVFFFNMQKKRCGNHPILITNGESQIDPERVCGHETGGFISTGAHANI